MIGPLIASFVSGETAGIVSRARRTAILLGIAGVSGLAGVGFLVGAGYIAVARRLGEFHAALWFGGGFLLLAILLFAFNAIISRSSRRVTSARRRSEIATIATAAGVGMLPVLLKSKGGGLVVPLLGLIAYAIYRENARGDGAPPKT
ncbi:MAG: hypothetical protein AB7I79_04190 [Rhizobiaceae bacterium]